ncbi:MAG: peptidase T [Lachnospiraceae bacterium]
MSLQERFLKYVSVWTTSEEDREEIPSTKRQLDLAQILEEELKELGLEKVKTDEHGYVYGLIPATEGMEEKKSVGFIAHMDTAPDYLGKDVKPQIIENYDGKDIFLKGSGEYIRVSDFADLATLKGRTVITTDGTTLLGADDKAGIAAIMQMAEEIQKENLPHGDIWIGFTPDEEVGKGADLFDLDYFKADFAYTVDGGYEGEVAYENFNAASAEFVVHGVNVHPGEAKDIMVNAASIACEIQGRIPAKEVPEHTEKREGFYHLTDMEGNVEKAVMSYIVRDHDKEKFKERLDYLKSIEKELNEKYGEKTVELTIKESYRNMLEIIEKNMEIVDIAKSAIAENGMEPVEDPIRGGTDGASLSFKGLPCPNLGTGGYGYHGPMEHVSVEGMETVVNILKSIIKNIY